MPKLPHEALVQLVRAAPRVILELLRPALGGLPAAPVAEVLQVTAAELVNLDLPEYRADAVIVIGDPRRPIEAFIIEVQGEISARKRRVWPFYVTGFGVRFDCPVTLVVIALDAEVAAWCAEPIDFGRGRGFLHPLVIGPRDIPVIIDPEVAAAAPELAVLSVAAHGHEPGAEFIAQAALNACGRLDRTTGLHYADFINAFLGEFARMALRQLMQFEKHVFYSDWAREAFAEGEAKGKVEGEATGKAKSLLKMFRLRGWTVPADVEARVLGCRDEEMLDRWMDRVLAAASLAGVFEAG